MPEGLVEGGVPMGRRVDGGIVDAHLIADSGVAAARGLVGVEGAVVGGVEREGIAGSARPGEVGRGTGQALRRFSVVAPGRRHFHGLARLEDAVAVRDDRLLVDLLDAVDQVCPRSTGLTTLGGIRLLLASRNRGTRLRVVAGPPRPGCVGVAAEVPKLVQPGLGYVL